MLCVPVQEVGQDKAHDGGVDVFYWVTTSQNHSQSTVHLMIRADVKLFLLNLCFKFSNASLHQIHQSN